MLKSQGGQCDRTGSSRRWRMAPRGRRPRRKGVPWWLVLIEGIGLLALGLYMFVAPVKSRILLRPRSFPRRWAPDAVQLIGLLRAKGNAAAGHSGHRARTHRVGRRRDHPAHAPARRRGRSKWDEPSGARLADLRRHRVVHLVSDRRPVRSSHRSSTPGSFFVFVGLIMLIDLVSGNVFRHHDKTAINFVLLLVGGLLILWSLVLRNKKRRQRSPAHAGHGSKSSHRSRKGASPWISSGVW